MEGFSGAFYDAGGEVDYFAMLTSFMTKDKILLTDARSWRVKDYPDVEDFYGMVLGKIAKANKIYKFKYNVFEKNNIGTTIINSMRFNYRIPAIAITTSNNLSEEKKRELNIMDKNETIAWINRLRQSGVIEFPETMTKGLAQLKDELDNFGAIKKGNRIVFESLNGNDDLVMCLALNVHFAMRKILKFEKVKEFFSGVANNLETSAIFPKTDHEKTVDAVKEIMKKKGTLFDKIDITFPKK